MKTLCLILLTLTAFMSYGQESAATEKQLFVYGGQITRKFIQFTAALTNKKTPRICFVPTASGDNPSYINLWYQLCADLEVEPYVLKVWINSPDQKESWEEILTRMDAVIVGGGNTLNMLAIWKAQEIDVVLRNVYAKGVVLAGGSAGSLCWFNAGTTDSRPKELTIVEGLGLLDYSHCPHYNSEASRRPLYHKNILNGALGPGYACDDKAGLLFVNGKLSKAVALDKDSHSYFVGVRNGKITEDKIESVVLD